MDLFSDENTNLLPYNGTVNYYGRIVSVEQAQRYYQYLRSNIPWKNDEAILFNKHIVTARKVAWYGDKAFAYRYSGTTKYGLPWTKELLDLKTIVEQKLNCQFNSCLLNLYPTGNEGMAWHSDDEKALGKNTTIASLTFGAQRYFSFKHKKTNEKVKLLLEHGSLLVMKGVTQTYWLHRLPPTTHVKSPRINLTFRTIVL
ncbi:MAG: alpha-ketoglutarate-dependent dioxygenase AlkB [Flavobacteriales bacterium]|jgi:alkylated DNA repair dioxygenase AlkB|nr:alpha-ketoglutarate-dependent dioxygenase AlkB [Flavobacteriales bacterium]